MDSDLLEKYLDGKASEEEVRLIFDWIREDPENKACFIRLKKARALSAYQASGYKVPASELLSGHTIGNTGKKHYRYYITIAAIAIFFLGIWGIRQEKQNDHSARPDHKVVVLRSRGGVETELSSSNEIRSNGELIARYNEDSIAYSGPLSGIIDKEELQINVPFGKTYKAKLPDGSSITLNAGSQLRFSNFIGRASEGSREVWLTGEAYFDIPQYKGTPFVVHTEDIDVRVLGTHFNVSAYARQPEARVLLTEGSVTVKANKADATTVMLQPGEIARYHKKQKHISIHPVNNYNALSWMHGTIVMQNMLSNEIFELLEIHFGVTIKNEYDKLKTQKFSGTLNLKQQSLNSILNILKLDTNFTYRIKENIVIITKPE